MSHRNSYVRHDCQVHSLSSFPHGNPQKCRPYRIYRCTSRFLLGNNKATTTTAHGKAHQSKEITIDNQNSLVAAVYYKSTSDVESQIGEHTGIQLDATQQLTENWKKDQLAIFAQYWV